MHASSTPPSATHCYFGFGFPILSDFALAELPELAAIPGGEIPLRIRRGTVSEDFEGAVFSDDTLKATASEAKVFVPGVASYHIIDGREAIVDVVPGADPREIRAYLLASVLGVVCHQRGLLPLHANGIAMGGGIVAIAGDSGAGKSTLAAQFERLGHQILSDDTCVLRPDAFDPVPRVWAGVPRIRLWRDAADALGRPTSEAERVVDRFDKFSWTHPLAAPSDGLALRAVYVLEPGDNPEVAIGRQTGSAAVHALMRHTYRRELFPRLKLVDRLFGLCAGLAARVPVYQVAWRHDFGTLEADAVRLRDHVLATAADRAASA